MSDKKKQVGLECPECGCKDFRDEQGNPWVTTNTIPILGAIRRYKYCRYCGKKIRTKEVIERSE